MKTITIFATRKACCIIWYAQILGAIFFGTFWISTNRDRIQTSAKIKVHRSKVLFNARTGRHRPVSRQTESVTKVLVQQENLTTHQVLEKAGNIRSTNRTFVIFFNTSYPISYICNNLFNRLKRDNF